MRGRADGDEVRIFSQTQGRWGGGAQPYTEQQPADQPNEAASYSTGSGAAQEYSYQWSPTYRDQYASDHTDPVTGGMANNPT